MRRLITLGAAAILVLAAATSLASAATTPLTKHVDGSVVVYEPSLDRTWMARFEVRTTSGVVEFGYLEMYGLTAGKNGGEIHQYSIDSVDYYRTESGAQGATLYMQECIMVPYTPCFPVDYLVSDKGQDDTFLANLDWEITSGNISIYTTGGQNGQ